RSCGPKIPTAVPALLQGGANESSSAGRGPWPGCGLPARIDARLADALLQVADQPGGRLARLAPAAQNEVVRHVEGGCTHSLDLDPHQPSGRDILAHHVEGHVAEAGAGQEEAVARRQVDEAPGMRADYAAQGRGDGLALGAGEQPLAIGEHELDMALQLRDRDRPAESRQGMP